MTQTPWIVQYKREHMRPQLHLFCFPYAGGGASVFRNWSHKLPDDIEINVIQYPGRENRLRETFYTDLQALTQRITTEIQPYIQQPFAFFGHSLGAMLAFEVARLLRRQQQPQPQLLCVSASDAPQVRFSHTPIYALSDEQFAAELRRYEGTPEIVIQDPDLRSLFFPILRADLQMLDVYKYQAEEPLDYPIIACGGLQDKKTQPQHLNAWEAQTSSAFRLHWFQGGHFYLNNQDSLLFSTVAQELHAQIATDSIA